MAAQQLFKVSLGNLTRCQAMTVQDDKKTNGSGAGHDGRPASLGRRTLLRRGVVAMPAILTLQSGAALARSSNLISASSPRSRDRLGRTLCVDSKSVYRADGRRRGVYDLGDPPRAKVNIIRERDYFVKNSDDQDDYSRDWESKDTDRDDYQNWGNHEGGRDYYDRYGDDITRISEGEMCSKGGTFWFKPRHGRKARSITLPKNGFVVSAGAAGSFADVMTVKLM